ncbi:unnamed protein product [Phytomonas sp. EM1]|nr:unnamed protein product [Phytomonas sp. EM1]|eukprot:CCW63462.1 unnamed protein product [Phytomonas sp. isolate EM1]
MLRASASSIQFTSIYEGIAAKTSSAASPYAFLLEIDGTKILLDCGWDDSFSPIYLETLRPYLSGIDAVLLSSPDIASCGALPYVMEHLPPGVFVSASNSTAKIGLHSILHTFLYQFPNAHTFSVNGGVEESFVMSVDSIYSAFRSTREPYGGKVSVGKKNALVNCHAVFAGRMLGGYSWIIRYQIDEIFYCPDFSLKPSYVLKRFNVPTTSNIVCIGSYPMHTGVSSGIKYEEQLKGLFRDIQHTLRSGGTVLIPCSVAGRGLEIVSIISKLLLERGGDRYKVILAALQSQEIMDKATTMTEVLQENIVLGDQALFSSVIACSTANDVIGIAGPKVCVADGPTLDYGISAELLAHLFVADSQGSENLVVFTEPPRPGTNAHAVAQCPKDKELTFSFIKRTRLDKEELEEYYVQQERELMERRTQLEAEGNFKVNEYPEKEGDDDDLSDDDTDSTQDTALARDKVEQGEKTSTSSILGLVLPSYINFSSKHLNFPALEMTNTLSAALMRGENVAYGLPVSDEEQMVLQKRAPARISSDKGPEELHMRNDAQREANIPSKVFQVSQTCRRTCKMLYSDLSGLPDQSVMRSLFVSKFNFAKKVVTIRGTHDDWQQLSQFCRNEKSLKCGDSVFIPQSGDVALELATQVLSYSILLDSKVTQQLPNILCPVQETNSKGVWEVGWIDGLLQSASNISLAADSDEPEAQRVRLEGNTTLVLTEVPPSRIQESAEMREAQGLASGSFFVGNINLSQLRETARRNVGLMSDFHRKAPMLVFDEGVCVRKDAGGTLTLSSIATPEMFKVRKTVYNQFSQIM